MEDRKTTDNIPSVHEPVAEYTVAVPRAANAQPGRELSQTEKNEGLLRLLDEWMADESGHDERVWPTLAAETRKRTKSTTSGQTLRELQTAIREDPRSVEDKRRDLSALLNKWTTDDSGYGERVWPLVKRTIEENRPSYRSRFGEADCDA
ncbi:MAG: hypothetical protein CO096_08460 [Armatimonadetes bacterium CG_4_9_14_3_um_filter_66_14]|nr:MAG: hypothetical protein CO096_08460 [Armatimonadetes bacterium CG_4_9_14_3_um_filter_66_14]